MTPNKRASQGRRAPISGTTKVNCEVSWCEQKYAGAIGVIARNSDVLLVRGANQRMRGESAKVVEAKAILLGTKIAIKNGWERVEIESDSKVVNHQLRGTVHH